MTNQNKAYIYGISAILLWSTAATAFKLALEEYSFAQLLLVSSAIAIIAVTLILSYQKKLYLLKQNSSKNILNSAILGFLNPFAYYMVLLKAYSILPAQIAQPLNYIWPVVLVLLAAPILGQKLHLKSIIALLISFSGVVIISTQGNLQSIKINEPFGVILASGSSIIWALFWLFNVRDKRNDMVKLFYNFVFGFIYTSIYIIYTKDFNFEHWQGLSASVYVGLFEMGITFALWLTAMQLTSSTDKISNLVFLAPFVSLIFIHFILGEQIYYTTFIGITIILLGIGIQQYKKSTKN
ncbi:MAG: EamA family transporter [Bacteroidales bacterium]|nr:EamA family transporter [Bacteroidales bacterium]